MKKADNPKATCTKEKRFQDNSREAQRARLLKALNTRGPSGVTTLEAREELNILHPAGRVQELRDEGRQIATIWTTATNSEGFAHRIARYVLMRRPKGEAA